MNAHDSTRPAASRLTLVAAAAFILHAAAARAEPAPEAAAEDRRGLSVGYELLETSMNGFQNIAGEVGYRFDRNNRVSLSVMEVKLTERHLRSELESSAIDGSGVSGYFRGYEAHYHRTVWRGLHLSGAVGYYRDKYVHAASGERLVNQTATIGGGVGWRWSEPFGLPHAYVNLDIPVRYYLNPIEETKLGDATVRKHLVVNNIWLFVGVDI